MPGSRGKGRTTWPTDKLGREYVVLLLADYIFLETE